MTMIDDSPVLRLQEDGTLLLPTELRDELLAALDDPEDHGPSA